MSASAEFKLKRGHVYLVGAGPGDPGLLTLKGAEALARADYVLYDRLVSPEILAMARPGSILEYVGKEVGMPSGPRQNRINARLIGLGLAGHAVVRLKGGDPFVFGRGSEEGIELKAAGVSFTVIPGISSCIAGPAAAGIPVTHRGVANSFSVFAGREGEPLSLSAEHWRLASQSQTAVFLMGVGQAALIVEHLVANGVASSTPAAVVSSATLPTQRVVTGDLTNIVERSRDFEPPAVIVIGKTVALRPQLSSD